MKKELADHRPIPHHVPLKAANVFEAFLPYTFRHQGGWKNLSPERLGMHAHYQHLFIIRAIENPDVAALGQMSRRAPQEIMLQFRTRRRLKRVDLAALWVHSRHDVLNRAVFTSSIHRLEDQQHRPTTLGI